MALSYRVVTKRMLKYLILTVNDYVPWIWGEDQRRWVGEYLDSCARYFGGKLDVEIQFFFECSETSYPRDRIAGGFVSVLDTLEPLGESATGARFDGVVVVSRHRGDWQKYDYRIADSVGDPIRGWAFVRYDPPVVTERRYIYKYLVILSHEWLHAILADLRNTLDIDAPPYRDETTITEFLVDGIFPVQSLEEMGKNSGETP